jgi:SAM-dependent methyltransferase
MASLKNIEQFLDAVIEENLFKAKFFSSKEKLRFNLENLFKGIDLTGKRVLDIGGGYGLHSFYAGCKGADEVICLEPAIEGSSEFAIEKFQTLQKRLGIEQVTLQTTTFQDFENDGKLFDIILSHYSINHLDESACMTLRDNQDSHKKYADIAAKLSSIAKTGAIIIVCDCSNNNFFAQLGLKNPFAPTITWDLHQAPGVWINILKKAGYANPKVEWTSFGEFRTIGKLFLGYKTISYFLNSHFCFRMTKI